MVLQVMHEAEDGSVENRPPTVASVTGHVAQIAACARESGFVND
jgi:hypothetical protein